MNISNPNPNPNMNIRKDKSLHDLAEKGFNIAQFVAYEPVDGSPRQTYSAFRGYPLDHEFGSLSDTVATFLKMAPEKKVNIRSFDPSEPRSREFILGMTSAEVVEQNVRRLIAEGLHVIVNETVDPCDGGVSGVIQNDIVEFSPDDTPRCVEKPDVARLPFLMAAQLLCTVYGNFCQEVFYCYGKLGDEGRLEFSVHPKPRGWMNKPYLCWEYEGEPEWAEKFSTENSNSKNIGAWPNRFSRMIGDKAYGLLIANLIKCNVPKTTVISRRIAPFSFGLDTKSVETWMRTAPVVQRPGLFTTTHGWVDPYAIMHKEDPEGTEIASILAQQGVNSVWSGALITDADLKPIVEGCSGDGAEFMLGVTPRTDLPHNIVEDVIELYREIENIIGPVRFEWVHDGTNVWIVQMHKGVSVSSGCVIVPGEADEWIEFDVSRGLPELRQVIGNMDKGHGIKVKGNVGMTSHISDVLRRSGRPAVIV